MQASVSPIRRSLRYLRGLAIDANLALLHPPRYAGSAAAWSNGQNLDHPTYLRRGLVIAGLEPLRGNSQTMACTSSAA